MATANHLDENLRCSICQEVLLDPRPLPCGHSFCGPPRPCLVMMENGEHTMTCAICRSDFSLRAADIKPLYGIREYFKGTEQLSQFCTSSGIKCERHWTKECNLWCTECDVTVCELCIQDEHDEHPVRNLRKHLTHKIEQKFGTKIPETIIQYQTSLEKCVDLNSRMFTQLHKRYESVKDFLVNAESKQQLLHKYLNSIKDGSTCRLSILQELSEIDLEAPGPVYHEDGVKSLGVQVKPSTKSLVVQVKPSKVECFSQTAQTINVSASVQTEKSVDKGETAKATHIRASTDQSTVCVNFYPPTCMGHSQQIPVKKEIIARRTASIDFRMQVESRRPSNIFPFEIQLGIFRLEVFAYSRACDAHKGWPNCGESQLCLKVKRTWIGQNFEPFCHLDRCTIRLRHRKHATKDILSDWFYLNEEKEQEFLLYAVFLRRTNNWLDSNDFFQLKMLIEFHS